MLKAILSFSKKVPVPDKQYSSQSYHLSLEAELPDGLTRKEIHKRIHDTFLLVRASVESELNGGAKPEATEAAAADNGNGNTQAAARAPAANGFGAPASNKQIKFATDLAASLDIGVNDLNAHIQKQYGVKGLYDLNRKQATELIDDLKTRREKAA